MSVVTIDCCGTVRYVHDDELVAMYDIGEPSIRRASNVEPDSDGCWIADLSPVNGPRLGPFKLRREALDAERCWIENFAL